MRTANWLARFNFKKNRGKLPPLIKPNSDEGKKTMLTYLKITPQCLAYSSTTEMEDIQFKR
jgi:hypothetical protein